MNMKIVVLVGVAPLLFADTGFRIMFSGGTFTPQQMRLVVDVPSHFGITQIGFRLAEVSRHDSFCMGVPAPSGTGENDDDYSFSKTGNLTNLTVAVSDGRASAEIYCKDYGGYCRVFAEYYGADGSAFTIASDQLPRATHELGGTRRIADVWRDAEVDKWLSRHGTAAPFFGLDWDGELAALGTKRTDGPRSHAAGGDGLSVWKEYRGYWVDGGAHTTDPGHVALSPVDKDLLVQVMVQDDYLADLGTGAAVNAAAVQALDLSSVMHEVAKFYSHPTRGLGINLYWVFTPFTMPVTPHTYSNDNEFVSNLYRYTGDIHYTGQTITNGSLWIREDRKLLVDDPIRHREVFANGDDETAIVKQTSKFIQHNRNDTELKDFVKLVLPSRVGIRRADGRYVMTSQMHAEAHYDASPTVFQGAHVDILNISEDNFFNGGTHYSVGTFADLIAYCIAHELFHLIGDRHAGGGTNPLSGPFRPLSQIEASVQELLQVDLPNRASVLK